ncbi:MAG: hypothetical protein WCH99_18205 [Verrucomicrobiota bacterium]
MAAFYLIAYIVVVGIFIRVTTHWDREQLPLISGILLAAFIGWFVLLGMLIRGRNDRSQISVTKEGAKDGIKFFGMWLVYMLGLIAAAGILIALGWLLTGH